MNKSIKNKNGTMKINLNAAKRPEYQRFEFTAILDILSRGTLVSVRGK